MKKNKKERIAERLEILQKSRSTYDDNAQFRLKQIEARANHIRAIEERRRLETITTYLYEDIYVRNFDKKRCYSAFEKSFNLSEEQLEKDLSLFLKNFNYIFDSNGKGNINTAVLKYVRENYESSPLDIINDEYYNIYELVFLISCSLDALNNRRDLKKIITSSSYKLAEKAKQFKITTHKALYEERYVMRMILLIVGSLSENMGINETDARLLEALNLYRENKKHFYTLLKLYNENSNEKIRSIFVKNREKMRKVYLNKSITLEVESASAEDNDNDLQQENNERMFDLDKTKNILYIHRGNIVCLKRKHSIESMKARVTTFNDEKVIININHCKTCEKYFINISEYERYMAIYNFLPIHFEMVNHNGDFFIEHDVRAEASPLMLCGYSVSRKHNFSREYRHKVLERIICDGVLSKYEIMKYLDMFIRINGQKYNMDVAVAKWEDDLKFVREYNFDKQRIVRIDKIKAYNY